jgi:hypothetical protein
VYLGWRLGALARRPPVDHSRSACARAAHTHVHDGSAQAGASIRANGNSLGELGSRIVVETQIGLLRNDPNSYLYARAGWDPSKGVRLPNGDPDRDDPRLLRVRRSGRLTLAAVPAPVTGAGAGRRMR